MTRKPRIGFSEATPLSHEQPAASSEAIQHSSLASADLGAGIAEHAIELAHLFLERGLMFRDAHDTARAAADRVRAEDAYQLAVEATETANPAGRDLLNTRLARVREELRSFEVPKSVRAR